MRTIYLECNAGASGDMISAALAGLLEDPAELTEMVREAGIPGVELSIEKYRTSGIEGLKTHVSVEGDEEGVDEGHHHHHHALSDVLGVIQELNVSEKVRSDASAIYRDIAEAESRIHGKPVDMVHFHEVGALDAVTDIVGACLLFEKLSPEKVVTSPVRVGFGETLCAHGTLPIPAPATALLLKGIPVYAGDAEGEFCTPTGAAIIRHFTDEFSNLPLMTIDNIGMGMGTKTFPFANVLRAYLGETEGGQETVYELTCDIDDMTPEDLGPITDLLLKAGARDAFVRPCLMKKGRPGFELTCLCWEKDRRAMMDIIFGNTTTIGLRGHRCDRYAMTSRFETCSTPYGAVRIKVSEGFGHIKSKPEYEDVLRAAENNKVSMEKVRESLRCREGDSNP